MHTVFHLFPFSTTGAQDFHTKLQAFIVPPNILNKFVIENVLSKLPTVASVALFNIKLVFLFIE